MSPRNKAWTSILVLVGLVAVVNFFFGGSGEDQGKVPAYSLTALASDLKVGKVAALLLKGDNAEVTLRDGRVAEVYLGVGGAVSLSENLRNLGVTGDDLSSVELTFEEPSTDWGSLAFQLLPIFLFGGLIIYMMRSRAGSGADAQKFSRSGARLSSANRPTVTFGDVAGCDEAKYELQEVVEFLRSPQKFIALGARIPKGVLLVGPPGCGKTLLAKAVAGEAEVPFFSISGSEFVEMFVGVGASRVRDLFEQARKNTPCIVFMDEIDAVGRHRGAGLGGSHDEREQTLNQILVEMDGFDSATNLILMAATNRPDILDPALLRPGRFDRQVVIDLPDARGREEIFKIHVRGKPLAEGVDLARLARLTPQFTGADIENVVNEAAIFAARLGQKEIRPADFQEAIEKVLAGPERKSRVMLEEERRIVAYHEVGHALAMHFTPLSDPVQKVSVVSRGMALGYTMPLPEDRRILSRGRLIAKIIAALGGRAAEEIVFGDITTSAANDLQRVSKIARGMITELGMSEKLGPLTFGKKEELVFLGREISEQRNYSEKVAELIDEEVRQIVEEAYVKAKEILTEKRVLLDRIAEVILDKETLDQEEFLALVNQAQS